VDPLEVNVDEVILRIVLVPRDSEESLLAETLIAGAGSTETRWDSPGGARPHWSQ
jgi:hypothetical protein